MRDPDEVRLVIAGTEFAGWEAVTISMGVGHLADSFSVTAPFDSDRPEVRAAFVPFGYQRVELYIGDDKLLTGTIDKVTPSVAGDDRAITVEGRSLTGVLVDCSIDGPLEFSGLTLAAIARQLCTPFGVKAAAYADTPAIELARAEYGQTVGEFLNSIAAPRNLVLASGWGGELLIHSGPSFATRAPSSRLVEGQHPFIAAEAPYDGTRRFSLYKVAGQFAGEEGITGAARDGQITPYRPHLRSVGEFDADPNITAGRLRGEAYAASASVAVTVAGWRRPDGERWADRQIVSLLASSLFLRTEAPWLIANVTYKLDAGSGRTTALQLVPPETYSGATIGRAPWA